MGSDVDALDITFPYYVVATDANLDEHNFLGLVRRNPQFFPDTDAISFRQIKTYAEGGRKSDIKTVLAKWLSDMHTWGYVRATPETESSKKITTPIQPRPIYADGESHGKSTITGYGARPTYVDKNPIEFKLTDNGKFTKLDSIKGDITLERVVEITKMTQEQILEQARKNNVRTSRVHDGPIKSVNLGQLILALNQSAIYQRQAERLYYAIFGSYMLNPKDNWKLTND